MFWELLLVIGRLLGEPESPAPSLEDRAVLFVKRHGVVIGDGCDGTGDGGDAGVDAGVAFGDAGMVGADAGVDGGLSDGGVGDAGTGDASTCTGTPVDAITMIVQPEVSQSLDGARFAVLYVTPARPAISLVEPVFGELARITAPRIEIQEVIIEDPVLGTECSQGGCGTSSSTSNQSYGCSYTPVESWTPPPLDDAGIGEDLEIDMVGPYQVVRAQPTDTAQLAGWLDELGYEHTQDDLDAVGPYLVTGHTVVAVRLAFRDPHPRKLRPLSLTWPGTEIRVPVALSRAAGGSTPAPPTSIDVYVAAHERFALTAGELEFAGYTSGSTTSYLTRTRLLVASDAIAADDPMAVPTPGEQYLPVKYVRDERRVPVSVYCDDGEEFGCCNDCSSKRRTRFDLGLVIVAVGFVLRRPRRRRTVGGAGADRAP